MGYKMKGFSGFKESPVKQAIGGGPGEALEHWQKYKATKKVDLATGKKASKKIPKMDMTLNKNLNKAVKKTAKKVTKKAVKKGALQIAKQVGKRLLGPVGVALTAYDVATTIPKVSKATQEGLKERTKKETETGYSNPGVRKI